MRKTIEQAYEELRQIIDGGSESFTHDDAVQYLKDRLEQPEQEPLEYWNAVEGWVKIDEVREHFDSVGCGTIYKTSGEGRVPLSLCKAQSPQRKPLTDEQIDAVMPQPTEFGIVQPPWNGLDITILRAMARAIEAAHGIKGEA